VNFQLDGYLNGDDTSFALSAGDESLWEANKGKIILACVLALLSVAVCLFAYCCCKRRRTRQAAKKAAAENRPPREVPLQQRAKQQGPQGAAPAPSTGGGGGGPLPPIVVEPTAPMMVPQTPVAFVYG